MASMSELTHTYRANCHWIYPKPALRSITLPYVSQVIEWKAPWYLFSWSYCPLAEHTSAGTLQLHCAAVKLKMQILPTGRVCLAAQDPSLQSAAVWCSLGAWGVQVGMSHILCGGARAGLACALWLSGCTFKGNQHGFAPALFTAGGGVGIWNYLWHFHLHFIACWQISFHVACILLYHFGMNNISLLQLGLGKGETNDIKNSRPNSIIFDEEGLFYSNWLIFPKII